MNEYTLTLEEINPLEFFGVNNSRFNQLKDTFNQSAFVARGNEVKVQSSPADFALIKVAIARILDEIRKRGSITEESFNEALATPNEVEQEAREEENGEVILHGSRGNMIRGRTAGQRKIYACSKTNDIVFAIGPAGTGKTYTAVAIAVKALKDKRVKRIILVRPAVEAGESLGFLPGDLQEKVDPYLRPLYDALDDMLHHEKLKHYLESKIIEIAPLAYMRGRTLSKAFVILDEAQNATVNQFKMFLTRLGKDSKIIITGDDSQIDLPKKIPSGLLQARRILQDIKGIAFVQMTTLDVVRHQLVKKIILAYQGEQEERDEA